MKAFNHKEYEELVEYVYLEGTEISDYLSRLLEVWDIPESYGKSQELQQAIDKELLHWLDRFKTETIITETKVKQPDRICKELEWL